MRTRALLSVVAVVIAAQACCCSTILGGPEPPYPITPSDAVVQRFEERLAEAGSGGTDGAFTITVSDEEITSLTAKALKEQDIATPIGDPQVYFRNGRIEAYGTVQVHEALSLPGMIALSITTRDEQLSVTIEELVAGPIPVPELVVGKANDVIDDILSNALGNAMERVTIAEVNIGDGEMTISGQMRSD